MTDAPPIIDAHVHCGLEDRCPPQAFEDYRALTRAGPIRAAVMFAPVIEIYDRYDPQFQDTEDWQKRRQSANGYVLTLGAPDFTVFPYFFIWNDFAVQQLTSRHRGIKWHRHGSEPVYHYDDPLCRKALAAIRQRQLPVLLEEEFEHTLRFVDELAQGIRVIIPHLGLLNGGYQQLARQDVWRRPNVFADTALAGVDEMADYIRTYGHERLFFGSDFPFGDPRSELAKVLSLNLTDEQKQAVLGANLLNLWYGMGRQART